MLKAMQKNGKVIVITDEEDCMGEPVNCERVLSLETAKAFRDELNSAIKTVEEMNGFHEGVFIGTD